jgi:tetrahydromethanopterin S-methyltransferase subunit G
MSNVENIRGEYGVKGKKIDRSTAILGGLVSAFNF